MTSPSGTSDRQRWRACNLSKGSALSERSPNSIRWGGCALFQLYGIDPGLQCKKPLSGSREAERKKAATKVVEGLMGTQTLGSDEFYLLDDDDEPEGAMTRYDIIAVSSKPFRSSLSLAEALSW